MGAGGPWLPAEGLSGTGRPLLAFSPGSTLEERVVPQAWGNWRLLVSGEEAQEAELRDPPGQMLQRCWRGPPLGGKGSLW